jgi:CheY-like chemotaxis protein
MAERSKILIVDDEPFNVDLLEQQLEELGYETVSAAHGQEALAQVATEAPDLILLDVMMPIMDGFTVCRILKENEETRLIPIVIMTALGAVEDRIKGIEAGADDFLTKPVDDRELQARIQTALKLNTQSTVSSVSYAGSKTTSPSLCQRLSSASLPPIPRHRSWPSRSVTSRSCSLTSAGTLA